jgi:glycosyltransferase involved in cell wall biosynthesis
MLGPARHAMGGMAAVVQGYIDAGLFERWPIRYLDTHIDGSRLGKLRVGARALAIFTAMAIRGQIALAHIHVAQRTSFWRKRLFMAVAFAFRIPVVLHLHGSEFRVFYEQECGLVGRSLVRSAFERSAIVIALSSQWETWVKAMAPGANTLCLYNSVRLPSNVGDHGSASSPPTIVFLGRLGKRKGVYDLVAAVAALVHRFPDIRLILGGDGEEKEVLAYATTLGVSRNVTALGWVTGPQKEQALRAAWIFCLPSHQEGLPMALLEAMGRGLPVVTTPVGGIPDAIDSWVDGVLVPPGNVPALSSCLERLLIDDSLRRSIGRAARARVESQFTDYRVLPLLEDAYRRLAG